MAIKGRQTIRKSGGKRVRLWELETKPGTIIERPERAYLESLVTVDAMEATRANLSTDERFTEDGAKEQFRNYVLSAAVPVFHRGRRAIQQAQQQLAEKRAKLQPPRPPADAAGAIAMMEIRTWFAGPAPGGARRDHRVIIARPANPAGDHGSAGAIDERCG